MELRYENLVLRKVLKFKSKVFIGYGYFKDKLNFVGCIYDLYVDNKKIELWVIFWSCYVFGKVYNCCNILSCCFLNLCGYGGKCNDLLNGDFFCDCLKIFYCG